jgi:hypothetical protein
MPRKGEKWDKMPAHIMWVPILKHCHSRLSSGGKKIKVSGAEVIFKNNSSEIAAGGNNETILFLD